MNDWGAEFFEALVFGGFFGAVCVWIHQRFKLGSYEQMAQKVLSKAEIEADTLKKSHEISLKKSQIEQQKEMDQLWQTERRKIQYEEERLKQKEDKLDSRTNLLEKKYSDFERHEAAFVSHKSQFENEKNQLHAQQQQLVKEWERVSGLTAIEARELLLNRVREDVQAETANFIRRTKKEAEEEAEREASKIIVMAINRLAVSCVSEATVNTVAIPNDELKGRIIGREGRNVRALEHATGVNFVIDETPGAVVLSGYDPIRLHVAKMALSELVADGRIYPTRIEEVVEKAKQNVKRLIRQYGEDAAIRAGIMNLHPEIIILLGKLKFRFSYGQNVLDHSLEVSHLMGMMAAELGLDVRMAKRIGLLHDMGKAVTHEIEGSHAIIGHDLALKYGETKEVANGIGCHHYEMEAITIEGSFCSAANSISASRPGARIEAVEEYIKRLKRLEDISLSFSGVEKAYAMQAGREVRIVVVPDMIDDDALVTLTREVSKRIEKELSYPGRIKVTAIREKRVVEYAS